MARTHAKKKKSNDPSFKKMKPLGYLPTQRKFPLGLSEIGSAATEAQFDSGRILSQVNHRLYRYGKRYTQKIDVDPSFMNPGATVDVYALMDTWYVQKAYEEAATVFHKAYENERENLTKGARARWFDFRIDSGIPATVPDLFALSDGNPRTFPPSPINFGEFLNSIVEDSVGGTRSFSWTAVTSATVYNVMSEYNLAGNTDSSPTTSTGAGPYDDLEADSSAIEMEALQNRGNLPPYNNNGFPSVWVKIATLTVGAAGNQKISTGFFDAPCGLVYLKAAGTDFDQLKNGISLTVQTGDYKGVKAHNMERM